MFVPRSNLYDLFNSCLGGRYRYEAVIGQCLMSYYYLLNTIMVGSTDHWPKLFSISLMTNQVHERVTAPLDVKLFSVILYSM